MEEIKKWIGFAASLFCSTLTGLFLSFSVYAVQLKQLFRFNQTQVSLLQSSVMLGLSMVPVGYLIYGRFGHRACYLTGWFLAASSGTLIWVSTLYPSIFKDCLAVMGIFFFINSMGLTIAYNCCVAIAVQRFSQRHTAKVVGVSYAFSTSGSIFYAVLYEVLFQSKAERLSDFFLIIPIMFTAAISVCVVFHSPISKDASMENERYAFAGKTTNDDNNQNSVGDKRACAESSALDTTQEKEDKSVLTLKDLLTLKFVHALIWPGMVMDGCCLSVLNNLSTIAKSANVNDPETVVYEFAVCGIVGMVSLSVLYDFFGTLKSGIVILTVSLMPVTVAMTVGLFDVNVVSIYFMSSLVAFGSGGILPLTVSVLSKTLGAENFSLIVVFFEVGATIWTSILQLIIGAMYDRSSNIMNATTLFCIECFYHPFVLWLSLSVGCVFTLLASYTLLRLKEKNIY